MRKCSSEAMRMRDFDRPVLASMVVLALGLALPGCSVDPGEMTLGVASDSGSTTEPPEPPPPPGTYCANPNFADSGPENGENYVCEGHVEGKFTYKRCVTGACSIDEDVPIDGETGDGEIPFPSDPTEGQGVDVHTCCDEEIENQGQPGEEEGDEACLSACAYAACNEALARFKALLADPNTWAGCEVLTPPFDANCIERVQKSLKHYIGFIENNLDACVQAAVTENLVFEMGNPGCTEPAVKTGCLSNGVLAMHCASYGINLGETAGACTESPDQPPELVSQECEIDLGGGEIRWAEGLEVAAFESGAAVTRFFDCTDATCPFVLDGLSITIDDIQDGDTSLTNLEAELIVAAYGQSDGEIMEFAPGALRIRVTGDVTDLTGTAPFEALGANTNAATGTHDLDLLNLGWVIFEAGGYTISAQIEDAECDDL